MITNNQVSTPEICFPVILAYYILNAGEGSEIMYAPPMSKMDCCPALAPLTPPKEIKEKKCEETSDGRIKIETQYKDGSYEKEIWYQDNTYERVTISADRKTIIEQDKHGYKYRTKITEDGSREGPEIIGSESCHPCKPSWCDEPYQPRYGPKPSAPKDKKTPDTKSKKGNSGWVPTSDWPDVRVGGQLQ